MAKAPHIATIRKAFRNMSHHVCEITRVENDDCLDGIAEYWLSILSEDTNEIYSIRVSLSGLAYYANFFGSYDRDDVTPHAEGLAILGFSRD